MNQPRNKGSVRSYVNEGIGVVVAKFFCPVIAFIFGGESIVKIYVAMCHCIGKFLTTICNLFIEDREFADF